MTPPMARKVDFTAYRDEWDKRPWPVNRDGMAVPQPPKAPGAPTAAAAGPGQPASSRNPRDVELRNV